MSLSSLSNTYKKPSKKLRITHQQYVQYKDLSRSVGVKLGDLNAFIDSKPRGGPFQQAAKLALCSSSSSDPYYSRPYSAYTTSVDDNCSPSRLSEGSNALPSEMRSSLSPSVSSSSSNQSKQVFVLHPKPRFLSPNQVLSATENIVFLSRNSSKTPLGVYGGVVYEQSTGEDLKLNEIQAQLKRAQRQQWIDKCWCNQFSVTSKQTDAKVAKEVTLLQGKIRTTGCPAALQDTHKRLFSEVGVESEKPTGLNNYKSSRAQYIRNNETRGRPYNVVNNTKILYVPPQQQDKQLS